MNPFSKILAVGSVAVALLVGNKAQAQFPTQSGTNGWPIGNLNVYPPVFGTLGPGPYTVLQAIQVPPATTNQYVPGLFSSTNSFGTNMNQLFIGASYWNDMGFSIITIIPTNSAAPYSTNLPGWMTMTLARSPDGIHVENVPGSGFTLSLLSSNNYCLLTNLVSGPVTNLVIPQGAAYSCVFTDLVLNGAAGVFVTSLANTNAGAQGPTNYVYLVVNPKATKNVSIPGVTTQ